MEYNVVKCTRCGQPFKDLRINVTLDIMVDRLTETGLWEEIPNLYQTSQDYLCKDCFDTFASILEKMNEPSSEQERIRMNQKKDNVLDGIEPVEEQEQLCECKCEQPQPQLQQQQINPLDLVEVEADCKYSDQQH